VFIESVVKAAK